ncbi:MAG: chemotaxis protein CheA, partial [Desulfovibrio sp.]|nr:chemotaxis protein CheA [Desulfovibrio sp.]
MSQEFSDPELFADFITEAKEHLETIEPNLLELEKAPDNLALLNDIFRPMHSLKGASGFLGLNRINHLAHKSENILDELRKGAMQVTSEIMDVILASTDALRQMIENLEATNAEGDVETESIIAQIDAIMSGETPQAPQENAEEPLIVEATVEREAADAAEAAAPETVPVKSEATPAGMSNKEWVATLPVANAYALTAFGEGHLKDFMDESFEIIENLNTGLLELEENPT